MAKSAPPELPRRVFLKTGVGATLALPLALQACGESPVVADASDVVPAPDTWDQGVLVSESPATIDQDLRLFSLGVSAGGMSDRAVCFWSFTEDDAPKTLKVWRPAEEGEGFLLVRSEEVTPTEGYLKAVVDGLTPATWYDYAFFGADGATRSASGRVRTAFAEGAMEPMRLAATTCTHFTHMPYPALWLTAKYDFDAFCHLGDMTYNDGARTKAEFRTKWRATLKDPSYQAILQRAGFYITLDDHELTDNSTLYKLPPEAMKAGLEAFHESVPAPKLPDNRIWTSYRWGNTAEIFVLDCRTERKPETRVTTSPIYISEAQMTWLKAGLSSSPCKFKVILNSVPIVGFTDVWPERPDRWQSYEEQREELLSHIVTEDISDVLFLTGDYHLAYVARLDPDGPYRNIWEVMVGPGAPRVPNPLVFALEFEPDSVPEFCPEGQFDYLSARNAATLLDLDPARGEIRIRYIDAETEEMLYDRVLTSDAAPRPT